MAEPRDPRAREEGAGLLSRFPALLRLGRGRKGRIPFVQQLSATECGAACLAMVLAYHGRVVRLDEVREAVGADRDGTNVKAILDGARAYGLRGRGVKVELEQLGLLDPASILHWEFRHFVVFERAHQGGVDLVDPELGRRTVTTAQFRKAFTGVALLLEPTDDFEPRRAETNAVWRYLRQNLGRSGHAGRLLVTSGLLQLFALGVPLLTGAVVDRVVPRADHHLLLVLAVGLLSLVAFQFLSSMIRAHLLLQLRTVLDARLTLDFLDHLVDLPYAFFQRRSAGDLMMRLNSNATIREILTSGALSGVLDGSLATLYLGLLLALSPKLALLVVAFGALEAMVFLLSRRRQRELMTENLQSQARSESYQVEMLSGIETLKAMGSEQRAVEHWSDLFVDVLNVSLRRGRLAALLESTLGALRLAAPLALLGYGALLVLRGELTLGTMLGLNALAAGFLGPLGNLVGTAGQLQLLGSYLERIDDVLDTAPEQDRRKVRKAHALRGQVTLEEVSFRYGPRAPLVVKGVSIDLAPGQFVAIVGRSGSGKSTLASLLVGLHRPTSGRVLYDGSDLAELDLRGVRRQVGVVTQQPTLFGASVRANIALADPSLGLPAVVDAARTACIHDEILQMAMGYETLLLDGGASLSGGQRQRVALARALLGGPRILLLDEATSALDAVTEARVQAALAGLGCTRITVAHRLSTVVDADRILVMEAGVVVEEGRHEELLARRGAYAALVAAQLEAMDG